MNKINAFVGHSFLEEDKALVERFLACFRGLETTVPHFSWQSAEAANPKTLTEKVTSIISEKNVFIGICTKRERVLVGEATPTPYSLRSYFSPRRKDYEWKASDWIIQEIGLAIGRGLPLILFIEKGVRKPGGLQGDVEYIPFEREFPEGSFVKFTQMLGALVPNQQTVEILAPETKSLENEPQTSQVSSPNADWKAPLPNWQRGEFEDALVIALFEKDEEVVARITDSYLSTQEGLQQSNRVTWQAFVEGMRLLIGQGGNLSKLMELARENPGESKIQENLGFALMPYDNVESAKAFEAAAEVAADKSEAARYIGQAALQLAMAGEQMKSVAFLEQLKTAAANGVISEAILLDFLRRFAESTKDDDVLIAVLERVVENNPGDFHARFVLGLKHSNCGRNDLALYHYLKIPEGERASAAWNNIGVAFNSFDLNVKAISAYRKAEGLGETLAMSNLAGRFLRVGFLQEAEALCSAALKIEGFDKAVVETLSHIKDKPEEEEKKLEELIDGTKAKAAFFKTVGRAITRATPRLASSWKGPKCDLTLEVSAQNFRIVGTHPVTANPFGALSGLTKLTADCRMEFAGVMAGQVLIGELTQKRSDEPAYAASILLGSSPDSVLMHVSDDGSEIVVMENPCHKNPTVYSLIRQDEAVAQLTAG